MNWKDLIQDSDSFILITYFSTIVSFNSCQRKTNIEWEDDGKISNKNKLILTEIFPLVSETWYLKVGNGLLEKTL